MTRPASDLALYRRLLLQTRTYWVHMTGLFLLSVLATPLILLTPLPLKIAVDSVIGGHPLPQAVQFVLSRRAPLSPITLLIFAAGLMVLIAFLRNLHGLGLSLLRMYTGERMVLDFRALLFRHVQRLSLAYHDAQGTTDSTYRIQYDAAAIQHIAIDGVIPLVTEMITLAAMIVIIAKLDRPLALVALAITPALFLLARSSNRQLRGQWRKLKQLESSTFSVVQEVLTDVRVVKAFGQEDREQARFVRSASEGIQARLRVMLAAGGVSVLVGLTLTAGTAMVLFVGVQHVLEGAITLGALLMVMAYLAQLYAPLETISKKVADLQSSLASIERSLALLDQVPDVSEHPHAKPLVRATGAVNVRNVSFAYPNHQPVLYDISFDAAAGARVGIMGTTGAGKTTLINLLVRFYDPLVGSILLDRVELRDYKLADLRNQFAIVLQEPVLFSTSIAENIAYARPQASLGEIAAAAKAANAHEFISALPSGYGTLVGARGMRLSGGERQRISLARAFLKNAPILILDEPTSSVDTKTEAAILQAMERLMHGRTTFMIAHRLSTLENCDLLLVLEGGRLLAATSDVAQALKFKDVLVTG